MSASRSATSNFFESKDWKDYKETDWNQGCLEFDLMIGLIFVLDSVIESLGDFDFDRFDLCFDLVRSFCSEVRSLDFDFDSVFDLFGSFLVVISYCIVMLCSLVAWLASLMFGYDLALGLVSGWQKCRSVDYVVSFVGWGFVLLELFLLCMVLVF